jgi:hypothetical protein
MFLDIVERIKPQGAEMWNRVADDLRKVFSESVRDAKKLKEKFTRIKNKKPSTGHGSMVDLNQLDAKGRENYDEIEFSERVNRIDRMILEAGSTTASRLPGQNLADDGKTEDEEDTYAIHESNSSVPLPSRDCLNLPSFRRNDSQGREFSPPQTNQWNTQSVPSRDDHNDCHNYDNDNDFDLDDLPQLEDGDNDYHIESEEPKQKERSFDHSTVAANYPSHTLSSSSRSKSSRSLPMEVSEVRLRDSHPLHRTNSGGNAPTHGKSADLSTQKKLFNANVDKKSKAQNQISELAMTLTELAKAAQQQSTSSSSNSSSSPHGSNGPGQGMSFDQLLQTFAIRNLEEASSFKRQNGTPISSIKRRKTPVFDDESDGGGKYVKVGVGNQIHKIRQRQQGRNHREVVSNTLDVSEMYLDSDGEIVQPRRNISGFDIAMQMEEDDDDDDEGEDGYGHLRTPEEKMAAMKIHEENQRKLIHKLYSEMKETKARIAITKKKRNSHFIRDGGEKDNILDDMRKLKHEMAEMKKEREGLFQKIEKYEEMAETQKQKEKGRNTHREKGSDKEKEKEKQKSAPHYTDNINEEYNRYQWRKQNNFILSSSSSSSPSPKGKMTSTIAEIIPSQVSKGKKENTVVNMISSDDDSEEEKRKEREIDSQTRSPALKRQNVRMGINTYRSPMKEKEQETETEAEREKEREDEIMDGLMRSLESENLIEQNHHRRMSDDEELALAVHNNFSQLDTLPQTDNILQ